MKSKTETLAQEFYRRESTAYRLGLGILATGFFGLCYTLSIPESGKALCLAPAFIELVLFLAVKHNRSRVQELRRQLPRDEDTW